MGDKCKIFISQRGGRGRDSLVDRCTISSYHHYSSNPAHGDVFSIQDYVIQFVSDLRWFSPCTSVSSTYKTDRHDIAELLLKVALNTKPLTHFSNANGSVPFNVERDRT
jgi:hypothetical protein